MRASLVKLHTPTEEYENCARSLIRDLDRAQDYSAISQCFENCLMTFFQSLQREIVPYAYWAIDDFEIQSKSTKMDHLSLEGAAYWLEGGENCSLVRVDIGQNTDPLLYSFKFYGEQGGSQKLYVAKTADGWFLNDA